MEQPDGLVEQKNLAAKYVISKYKVSIFFTLYL